MYTGIKPAFRLREMTEEDLPVIHQLEREAFQKAWTVKQLKSELVHPCNTAIVAEADATILGYFFSSDVAGEASLNRIAVAKAYRQRGVGKTPCRTISCRCERERYRGGISRSE